MRRRKSSVLGALVGVAGSIVPLVAESATLRVPSQYGTIQAGLDAAAPGDTVLVAPGTYSDWETRLGPNGTGVSSCAHLSSGVTLLSEGGPDVTTIDMVASGSFPTVVWGWNLPQSVRVEGFAITGSVSGIAGTIIWTSAKATLENCVFHDIGSGLASEGALAGVVNDLDVIGCKFIDIDAGTPSAISQGNAELYVEDCWFENCRQVPIGCDGGNQTGAPKATIRNSVFLNNYQSNGGGGAIFLRLYDLVEVSGCWFEGNVSTGTAGAFDYATFIGTVSVLDNVFLLNRADGGRGGACWLTGKTITVTGNTFFQCTQALVTRGGAAVVLEGGTSTFENNVVSECSGGTGAVRLEAGTATSDCNVFWSNVGGDLDGISYGAQDRVVDPEFCDPDSGDLTVHETSPCLPANSGGCGQIGAEGMGCGTVSVETDSWGAIKGKYRDQRP